MADFIKNQKLISNQVFQKPQDCTEVFKESTGEIIYANSFAGINSIQMPDDYKLALNNDFGEVGNNIIIQLQQKVQQFPDGPWYVDSIDGVIYIHNRKLQEPSRAIYTYQSENGELLNASFETQYLKRSLRGSTSTGIDMDKSLNTEGLAINSIVNMSTSYEYMTPDGNFYPQQAINDFKSGKTTYNQLLILNERVKEKNGGKGAFTSDQWREIKEFNGLNKIKERRKIESINEERYRVYRSKDPKDLEQKLELSSKDKAISETLSNQDLTANVNEYLTQIYGSEASKVMQELDKAAKDGTLDAVLKQRYSEATYTFSPNHGYDWQGANVEMYSEFDITSEQAFGDNNLPIGELYTKRPDLLIVGDVNGNKAKVFGKKPITAQVSGYRLLKSHYSRKYGYNITTDELNRRVLAVANQSKKIIEKKLQAKVTVVGRPSLATSQVITLLNIGKRWSGQWYIKKCIHNMDPNSGYTTQLELVKHPGIDGFNSATQSAKHNIESGTEGSDSTSKPVSTINLTSFEGIYYNTRSSKEKEDLLILKMAGVQDAAIPTGQVGPMSEGTYIKGGYIPGKLIRKPTEEERKKYGRKAAKIVEMQSNE